MTTPYKCFLSSLATIFLLLIFFPFESQATIIYTESFETNAEGSNYNSTTFDDCPSTSDFFKRTNDNAPFSTDCATGSFGSIVGNVQGSYFWASEDIGGATGNGFGANGNVTSVNIDISGASGLTFSVYLANVRAGSNRWETGDLVRIQYAKDGGSFTTVSQFITNNGAGGELQEDTNVDGTPDGSILTTSLTKYSYVIPDGGTNLQVRVEVEQDGGTEEFAFDLLEVDASTLPVNLSSFVGISMADAIALSWETAQELNNAGFEIHRSSDLTSWDKLGFIEGNGTSSITNSYQFEDSSPIPGLSYYRLKQIDFDGKFEFSKRIEVFWEGKLADDLKIFPNPAHAEIEIALKASETIRQIQIFDLQGKLIWKNQGILRKIAVAKFDSGIYLMVVKTRDKSYYQKFEII